MATSRDVDRGTARRARPATAWYTFSTVGSTYDTVLGLIWPSCSADEVVCSDDAVDVAAELTTAVTEGEVVLILLDAVRDRRSRRRRAHDHRELSVVRTQRWRLRSIGEGG